MKRVTDHLLTCPTATPHGWFLSDCVASRRRRRSASASRCAAARRGACGLQNDNVAHQWSPTLAGIGRRLDQLDDILWMGNHR